MRLGSDLQFRKTTGLLVEDGGGERRRESGGEKAGSRVQVRSDGSRRWHR